MDQHGGNPSDEHRDTGHPDEHSGHGSHDGTPTNRGLGETGGSPESPVVTRSRARHGSGPNGSILADTRVRWGLVVGAAAVLIGGGALISGCLGGDEDVGDPNTSQPSQSGEDDSGEGDDGGSGAADPGSADPGSADGGSGDDGSGGSDTPGPGSGLSVEEAAALPVSDTEAYCESVAVVYGIEASQNSAARLQAVRDAATHVPNELSADVDLLVAGLEAEETMAGADQAAADAAAVFLDENQDDLISAGERLEANATTVCGEEIITGGADGSEPRDEGPIAEPTPEFAPEG